MREMNGRQMMKYEYGRDRWRESVVVGFVRLVMWLRAERY